MNKEKQVLNEFIVKDEAWPYDWVKVNPNDNGITKVVEKSFQLCMLS